MTQLDKDVLAPAILNLAKLTDSTFKAELLLESMANYCIKRNITPEEFKAFKEHVLSAN